MGLKDAVGKIDLGFITERMRKAIARDRDALRSELLGSKTIDFYDGEARFVGEHTLDFQGQQFKAKTIIIASGSRPEEPK